MKKLLTLREKIGQRLFIGFEGKTLTQELRQLVGEYKAGNVVLFRHNIDSIDQLRTLCRDLNDYIKQETGYPPFIAIDQEGGEVSRLSDDCVNVPGAMAIAATGRAENAYEAAVLTGQELRALGISFNFAPVADVCCNPDNTIIGIRSFGDTAEIVSAFALESLRGYKDTGIISCAKHFPGHGDTEKDSHICLPCIDKSLRELEELELIPFKAMIEAGCPAVMSAHILYPQIENVPATMSRLFMHDILRDELGFEGLVLSDSLEMDAIRRYFGAGQGAVHSIKAGVDIVLTGGSSELIIQEAEAIEQAAFAGELDMAEMDRSVERIISFKGKYCLPPFGQAGLKEHRARAEALRRQAVTLAKGRLPRLGASPLFVGPKDSCLAVNSDGAEQALTSAGYMRELFGGREFSVDNEENTEELISRAVSMVEPSSSVVINGYGWDMFPEVVEAAQAIINEARKQHIPSVAVLRSPNDLKLVPECDAAVIGWDSSLMTLELMADVLSGKLKPRENQRQIMN